MSAPVRWWCSGCNEPLHLANTLWKSADGDYLCNASSGDVIAEQYAAAGMTPSRATYRARIMHRPANDWVHPALRKEDDADRPRRHPDG